VQTQIIPWLFPTIFLRVHQFWSIYLHIYIHMFIHHEGRPSIHTKKDRHTDRKTYIYYITMSTQLLMYDLLIQIMKY